MKRILLVELLAMAEDVLGDVTDDQVSGKTAHPGGRIYTAANKFFCDLSASIRGQIEGCIICIGNAAPAYTIGDHEGRIFVPFATKPGPAA